MKQREYTEIQKVVIDVMDQFAKDTMFINIHQYKKICEKIKKKYDIKDPYLTLREYIELHSHGSYHTFKFALKGKIIIIDCISDMLTDELSTFYPLTKEYYVYDDLQKDNNGNCENYHCDHYLLLLPKED